VRYVPNVAKEEYTMVYTCIIGVGDRLLDMQRDNSTYKYSLLRLWRYINHLLTYRTYKRSFLYE